MTMTMTMAMAAVILAWIKQFHLSPSVQFLLQQGSVQQHAPLNPGAFDPWTRLAVGSECTHQQHQQPPLAANDAQLVPVGRSMFPIPTLYQGGCGILHWMQHQSPHQPPWTPPAAICNNTCNTSNNCNQQLQLLQQPHQLPMQTSYMTQIKPNQPWNMPHTRSEHHRQGLISAWSLAVRNGSALQLSSSAMSSSCIQWPASHTSHCRTSEQCSWTVAPSV